MLYVFLVDTGTVYTFDMNIALDTVANLKENVFRACNVPTEKQVLLISGGQSLDPSHRVCSYSAGTDTNPIFLFCKSTIECSIPPSPSINFGSAQELKDRLEVCLADKETTYQTVAARALLAQQFYETAREITRVCEQLVHDQHMQQLGWSAVVANLEDIVLSFKGRAELFEQTYHQYLNSREENLEILGHFCDDLAILSDIPILKSLINNNGNRLSLLDWIRSNDDENTDLNMVADHCTKALEQMDHHLLVNLEKHIESSLDSAERPEMKEIGGLAERLFGLEQLLVEARKKVQEQGELAQALHQNQQRARNLNDTSILPDLCASHRQQLKVMLRHDEKLRDIRSRCSRAKEELSNNLHARLRWVMFVQRQLAEVDSGLALQHENLRRLRRHFDLLRQLHLAPGVYLKSLIEVVRRRLFVNKFTQWATTVAGHSSSVHNGEITQRKTFSESCEGHFLTLLFPGIVDQFSPAFATSPPALFDADLPLITFDDLESLKQALPSLWSNLQLPDNIKDVTREPMLLDWLHSSSQNLNVVDIQMPAENRRLPSLTAALLSPPIRQLQTKMIKSKPDLIAPPLTHEESDCEPRPAEELLKEQRSQLVALKRHFQCAVEAVQSSLPSLRTELNSMQQLVLDSGAMLTTVSQEWRDRVMEQTQRLLASTESKCRERIDAEKKETKKMEQQKLTSDDNVRDLHLKVDEWTKCSLRWQEEKKEMNASAEMCLFNREKELDREKKEQLQQCVQQHRLQIDALTQQIQTLECQHQKTVNLWKSSSEQENPEALKAWRQELMLSHEMELEQVKMDKDSELNELQIQLQNSKSWQDKYQALLKESEAEKLQAQQNLQYKHRLEIEGLRSRFRIMASTALGDRSPSDTSLEKVEMRSTPPASPRNMIPSVTNNHAEKYLSESAIDQLERENEKLFAVIGEFKVLCKQGSVKATKWEGTFSNALQEVSNVLTSVTHEGDSFKGDSVQPKNPLITSFSLASPCNMAASVAVLQSSDDKSRPSLTPAKSSTKKKQMSKVTKSLIRQGSANVYGCEVGDAVLVQWDERYSTHMLYNKGPYLHFLHADSISGLNLQNVIEPFLARVLQREFCLVRKEENRYNLPKGTNFYRVKVERTNKINNGQ